MADSSTNTITPHDLHGRDFRHPHGWFKTGEDGPDGSGRYPDRHLFVRLQQDMNGTGEWTLELHDCRKAADGRATRVYDNEQDARTALALVYALTRHMGPLPDRFGGGAEIGRWEVHTYDLSDGDLRQLARFAASHAGGRHVAHPPASGAVARRRRIRG